MTPREIAFAKEYAATGDLSYSSHKAGYGAASGGSNALARPSVREKIAAIREARLPELVGVALDTITKVMLDPNAPASARVAAADKALKSAAMYRETLNAEIPIEEGDINRMLLTVNRTLVELVEHRPGEYASAVEDEKLEEEEPPEDEAAAIGEREGIFG